MMVKKLDELSLNSMDKEITEIEKLIKAMILVEADGVKEVLPIIDMDDVPMFDTTLSGARALEIKWLEEMEVTPSLGPSLPVCQDDGYDMEVNTDPTVGVIMETGAMENNVMEETVELEMMTGPGYMGVDMEPKECQEESMVVVVSRDEDPHHHGDKLIPVLGPTTLPENGGEGGQVLGLLVTVGHDKYREDNDIALGVKYCPGVEVTLPRYTYENHKPHCSRIWPDRLVCRQDNVKTQYILSIAETHRSKMTHTPPPRPIFEGNIILQNVETAHTLPPRPVIEQDMGGHIERITVVKASEKSTDLRKVIRNYENPKLEKLQSVGNVGIVERFCDVGTLVTEWERMENDPKEWEVLEGIRRGGRRVSKRMVELLGMFEGEGDTDTESVVKSRSCAKPIVFNSTLKQNSNSSKGRKAYKLTKCFKKENTSSSSSNYHSIFEVKKYKIQNQNHQNGNKAELFVDKSEVSERCDWSTSIGALRLTANEKPVSMKRVREVKLESENEDNWNNTKKRRIEGGGDLVL